jgi:hypothetical protein
LRTYTLAQVEQLCRDVRTYEAFGDHRTATAPDHATSRWLAHELGEAGLRPQCSRFAHACFHFNGGAVVIEKREIELFPLWPARPIAKLDGALARAQGPHATGFISFARLPYAPNASLAAPTYRVPIEAALARMPSAIIAATDGPTGDIIALNADLRTPLAAPVVLVAGRDADALERAARRGARARIRVNGSLEEGGHALNVVARRDGNGPTLVVSTPTSGWFACAGERGAGVAVFLALARWAVKALPNPLLFVATSGHEFEGLGSEHFLRSGLAPGPDETALWVHLGANIASRSVRLDHVRAIAEDEPSRTRMCWTSADLTGPAARAFAGLGGFAAPLDIDGDGSAPGDVRFYRAHGYQRILGLVGAHPLHHTRLDRAEPAIHAGELGRVAAATSAFIGDVLARSSARKCVHD